MISELAARVFKARDMAHREHWKTKSYAAHIALNGFYDDVIEAIDSVIEAYQGQFADIEYFEVQTEKCKDIRSFLQAEADWIEENRPELANGSACIENLVDTLTQVYVKAVFMLGMS